MCPRRRRARESTCDRDLHAQLLRAERSPGGLRRGACATCVAARMSPDMLRGRRRMCSRRLLCFPRMPDQSCRTEHICSAWPCVPYRCRHVCLWLWSVASAVGTRTGATSRCILAVYTSYKQYLTRDRTARVRDLTPKPSYVRKRTFASARRSLQHVTARLDAVGCCCEAARLKRTGQGYIAISGSFPLRPHPRQRQVHDCRCS